MSRYRGGEDLGCSILVLTGSKAQEPTAPLLLKAASRRKQLSSTETIVTLTRYQLNSRAPGSLITTQSTRRAFKVEGLS